MEDLAIVPLIKCLGKIGNNQHKKIPDSGFKKDSYPLPRDIASRSLIRIGIKVIPSLLEIINTANKIILSELIDTIGYINFYNPIDDVFFILKRCYDIYKTEDLILWKIIRVFSGIKESETFLKEQYLLIDNVLVKEEIKRSLRVIKKNNL